MTEPVQGLQSDGTLRFEATPPPGMTWDEVDAMENDEDDRELGAAWREAGAALPDGWELCLHSTSVGLTAACARHGAWKHDALPFKGVVVDTTDGPAATLRELTRRLRAEEPHDA